jgi:hypothetical protein
LPRRFRFRIRPGTAFVGASTDPETPGFTAKSGEEIVVSEEEAARLLRVFRRKLELLEVIDDHQSPRRKLPG